MRAATRDDERSGELKRRGELGAETGAITENFSLEATLAAERNANGGAHYPRAPIHWLRNRASE